jgi:hypothetical protein
MRRFTLPVLALALGSAAFAPPAANTLRWPPWLSIESPVNPFDNANRGALFLVHALTREGPPKIGELTGTAQGLVNGVRRAIPIRIDTTPVAGTFAVRKQWPSEGTWLVQVTLYNTTALVVLDRDGTVAAIRVPTELQKGNQIPRAVASKEVDSTLAAAAHR